MKALLSNNYNGTWNVVTYTDGIEIKWCENVPLDYAIKYMEIFNSVEGEPKCLT